jgi:hypothetical protein
MDNDDGALSFFEASLKSTVGNDEEEVDEADSISEKKKINRKKGECNSNPFHSKWWIRSVDSKQNAFYYNVRTAESLWLAPCAVCSSQAKKWCVTCKAPYCNKDFSSYHDETEWNYHKWTYQETCKRDPIAKDEAHCIECGIEVASKICINCWDPYCKSCFKLVHGVGYLKNHRAKKYAVVMAGWTPVKNRGVKGASEYYVNGTTGQTTYSKPEELMNPYEKKFHEGYEKSKQQLAEQIILLEKLQFKLEESKYERDKLLVEFERATKINIKRMELQKIIDKANP